MKPIFIALLLCILLPTIATADDDINNQPGTDISQIAGTYTGVVFNGDNVDQVMTTLLFNESGELVAEYAMGEEAGLAMGKLSNFRREGEYTFVADWSDKYGTGVLRMLFSSNFKLFYGLWGKTSNDTILPWNGIKNSANFIV